MFFQSKEGLVNISMRRPWHLSVASKLFIGMLTVNLLVIIVIVAVVGWNLRAGFASYITQANLERQSNLITRLEALYKADGNWNALQRAPQRWNEILKSSTLNFLQSEEVIASARERSFAPDSVPMDTPQLPQLRPPISREPRGVRPGDGQRIPHRPPPQAFEDCLGKQPGVQVMHRTPEGSVQAICEWSPEGLVARPIQNLRPKFNPITFAQDQQPPPLPRTPPQAVDRLSLFDSGDRLIAGHPVLPSERVASVNLKGDQGQVIGKLTLLIPRQSSNQDQTFIDYCMQLLMMAALCALSLSIIGALILSRNFVSILRRLANGAQKLASGRFDTRITGERSDEFGDLMKDFNRLAISLEQHEQSRRLWVAQTSHELRTPISVLRAHIEALIDGVRAVNKSELDLLHREVIRIGKLITDLNELSRADSGSLAFRKEPVELLSIIEEMIGAFSERCAQKSLAVTFRRHGNVMLFADQDRIRQVLANLFENSLRYTDSPGMIQIRYTLDASMITLVFEDSAPGVGMSALADLFDPFYRTDESRQRETGGSGLGLAIVRAIIAAHDGTIQASPSSLGGLAITICLPMIDKHHAKD
jgi:two-component system sensor histidine kinase BaeS